MSGIKWRSLLIGLVAGAMVVVALPVAADVGDAVLQGRANGVDARTTIRGSTATATLRLINDSNKGSGLVIFVEPGVAPIKVNSSRRVDNLNADLLDGRSGSQYAPKQARAGDLLVGSFGAAGDGTFLVHGATFATPLTSGIPQSKIHYRLPQAGPTNNCPGVFKAAPGHLCIYASWEHDARFNGIGRIDTDKIDGGASRYGFTILWTGDGSTANVRGNWAYRVPASGDVIDEVSTADGTVTDAGIVLSP